MLWPHVHNRYSEAKPENFYITPYLPFEWKGEINRALNKQPYREVWRIGMRAHDRAACLKTSLHDIVVKAGEEARCAPAVERKYP